MEVKKKKKTGKKPMIVKKPYLTGKPVDRNTVKGALTVLGMMAVMMVLFLLLGAVFMFDNAILRIVVNGVVLATCYMMFYYYGVSSGTQAVNHGEIMYTRRETGREVTDEEAARSYHPLKGVIAALIGSAPVVLCALVLALIAKRQTVGVGALPSWTSGLTGRAEFGDAVKFYSVSSGLGLEGVLRLLVRMNVMPWVNIFDAADSYAMLTLERISPVLLLVPAICYGVGYIQGPANRGRVHGDIAASKKKRAHKNRRDKQRAAQKKPKGPKGPEQLN